MGINDIIQTFNLILSNNSSAEFISAGLVFVVILILLKMFKMIIIHRLKSLAKKTRTEFDDTMMEFVDEINWPFLTFIAVYVASKFMELFAVQDVIDYMLIIFTVFYAVKAGTKVVDYIAKKEINRRKKIEGEATSLIQVFASIVKVVIWVIAILIVLSNLGFNVTSLLAGLGVGGIAIAFALQRILEDIFSSFTIYFDKPFREGDFIILGDDLGTVKKIGLKTTRIQHLQGQELVVSNRELTSTRIHNYKRMKKRRITFSFGVEYGTPTDKLKKIPKIVDKILSKIDLATLDRAHFKEFGDFSLNYEVVYYLDSSDYNIYMDVQQMINLALVENFEKENIVFAFPTQTIHLQKS